MEIKIAAASDLGNNETASILNGELFLQPSVIHKVNKIPFYQDRDVKASIEEAMESIVVNIDSPSMERGIYYIGKYALESETNYQNTSLALESKENSDVPIAMLLGKIGVKGMQEAYAKDPESIKDVIKINVDLVSGLPCRGFKQDIAEKFGYRFTTNTPHDVTIYLGSTLKVKTEIKFEFAKIYPEATPVIYSLSEDREGNPRSGDIFKEFSAQYELGEVDGLYFLDKRALHIDIGDITTEYPITSGLIPEEKFVQGSLNGIGHAVENILVDCDEKLNLRNPQRHDVSRILKDEKNKYYHRAVGLIQDQLAVQAQGILRYVIKQIETVKNELDVIIVYGGGSILLKDHLYNKLLEICKEKEIKLLYIPANDATTLYVEGLQNILTNGVYDDAKEQALKLEA